MAGNAANEIKVAGLFYGERVIAGSKDLIRGGGIACVEILVCHSHNIVKLFVVLKDCKKIDNFGFKFNQKAMNK